MNWTGGRLRRHSSNNNAGALTKTQKRLFAKSKFNASKGPRPVSPLQILSQFEKPFDNASQKRKGQDGSVQNDTHHSRSRKHNAAEETVRTSKSSSPHTKGREPPQASANLHDIKRRLLKDPDWAAISAARPLKMTFTPVEQQARFGKRRRLTDADRKRLASNSTPFYTPEFGAFCGRKRSYPESEAGPLEDIDIRINAHQPDINQRKRFREHTPRHGSSQSMLLDCKELGCIKQDTGREPSWSQASRKGTPRRSSTLGEEKASIICSDIQTSQFPSSTVDLPTANPFDQYRQHNMEKGAAESNSGYRYSGEASGFHSEDSSYQQTDIPSSRRFTIDYQFLAEKEGTLNLGSDALYRQDTHQTNLAAEQELGQAHSDMHQLDLPIQKQAINTSSDYVSPYGNSFSRSHCSSWLPEPRCNIQRPLGQQTTDDSCISLLIPSVSQNHDRSTSSSPNVYNTGSDKRISVSPVKVYGQSMFPDDNEIVNQTRQLSPSLANHGLEKRQQAGSNCTLWGPPPPNQARNNANSGSSGYQRGSTTCINSPRSNIESRSNRSASHSTQAYALNGKRGTSVTSAKTSRASISHPHSSKTIGQHTNDNNGNNEVTVYGQSLSSSASSTASPQCTSRKSRLRSQVAVLSSSSDPMFSDSWE